MKSYRFNEIDSTNDFARRLIDSTEITEDILITAEYQTKGRGRRNRKWISNKGENLMLTIITSINELSIYDVIRKMSVTLVDVLAKYNINAEIKWPNDILVNKEKICGMLIEKVKNYYVIGVGLNVNSTDLSLVDKRVTSLKLITGVHYNRDQVLDEIVKTFRNVDINKYQDMLYGIGTKVIYNEEIYNVVTVNEAGMLVIEKNNNILQIHNNEKIEWLINFY